jgi:hypothetical protein
VPMHLEMRPRPLPRLFAERIEALRGGGLNN